ncbi:glycosyltransferase family A protein [Desulfocastanea catecholica]
MKCCPVSVVIPTFNRRSLLKRAIDSVCNQTVQCSELIVVDDGSTDDTAELLRDLASSAKIMCKVYSQDNSGPAAARNYGIRQAMFPYIAFLDSDDHWQRRKLERQFQYHVDNPACRISHTGETWLRRGQHLNQKKKHIPGNGDIFAQCLRLCAVGMSTVMMKRELFDQVGFFDESLRCCEDYDLWLRISCRYPFLLVDKPLTVKEGGREDQVSSQYALGMDRMRIYSLRKLLDSGLLDCRMHLMALQELKKKITIFGNGCLKHNKMELGRAFLDLIPVYEEKARKNFPMLGERS